MKTTRTYTQRARAEATAGTRERIIAAVVSLAKERFTLAIVLADVAERAGVSVQTVLRHFGSRDGLYDAVRAQQQDAVRQERAVPVGDVTAAVTVIVGHYDDSGDFVLGVLAQEHSDEDAAEFVTRGRRLHRDWVREVFAPRLAGRADAEALTDLLVVATDVYTWKLLRRDAGHDRTTTEERMLRLVRAVLTAEREGD